MYLHSSKNIFRIDTEGSIGCSFSGFEIGEEYFVPFFPGTPCLQFWGLSDIGEDVVKYISARTLSEGMMRFFFLAICIVSKQEK